MADDPLVMPQDEYDLVKDLRERISTAIEDAWWSSQPASPAVMEVIGPLISRAKAAEAKLSAIVERIARVPTKGAYLTPEQELAEDLLDIITGKEEPS